MKFIYESEKRRLQLEIDDKTSEINYLNKEVEQLENENNNLKEKIPYDEQKIIEKNALLESNLKDLKKKLEQSQYERLSLENQCNTYVKSMKEKNSVIANLEKELKEMKKNQSTGSNVLTQSNIVKKITGGMN
jgi:chromosome segregation ATPase